MSNAALAADTLTVATSSDHPDNAPPDSAAEELLPGLDDEAFLGAFAEGSFTSTAVATTTADDRFMDLFNDAFNDSTRSGFVTDLDFMMSDYNYGSPGKELQLLNFSPLSSLVSLNISTSQTSPSSDSVIPRHFTVHSRTGIQQTCATMIIQMIYAYPRMMTRRETLPPFIHSFSPASDAQDGQNLPVYLINCMGIAQLFTVRTNDTRPFLWATIRAEMRNFKDRLQSFDRYDALSALQACLIYCIIRASDNGPQEAQHDYEMLSIHQVSCASEPAEPELKLNFCSSYVTALSNSQLEIYMAKTETNVSIGRIGYSWNLHDGKQATYHCP